VIYIGGVRCQGEHKISRGYLPTPTYSSHMVRDPAAAAIIRRYLRQEAAEMDYTIDALTAAASPFKESSRVEVRSSSVAMAAMKESTSVQRAEVAESVDGA
jgi:hypothetical protein